MLTRIRKAREDREGGFTLIELLVVMIIIGILAAIAIPVFLNQRKSGYDAGTKSDVRNGALAEEAYYTDSSTYTTNSTGAAGTGTGPLPGYSKSANTTSVTFTPNAANDGFVIIGISKTPKTFCYNSANSGAGVQTVATGATTC